MDFKLDQYRPVLRVDLGPLAGLIWKLAQSRVCTFWAEFVQAVQQDGTPWWIDREQPQIGRASCRERV